MDEYYEFTYENKKYKVYLYYSKRLKNSARFELVNDRLECRMAPRFNIKHAIRYIEDNKSRLSALFNRPSPVSSNQIYIFGVSREIIKYSDKNYIGGIGWYKNDKELNNLLKKLLLKYVQESYQKLIQIMDITDTYTCIIRNMKSRYGSISKKTNRIAISLKMIHYAREIIDSVIIHELAHTRYFDHSAAFYREIYKYCPDYKKFQRKLKRGEFE